MKVGVKYMNTIGICQFGVSGFTQSLADIHRSNVLNLTEFRIPYPWVFDHFGSYDVVFRWCNLRYGCPFAVALYSRWKVPRQRDTKEGTLPRGFEKCFSGKKRKFTKQWHSLPLLMNIDTNSQKSERWCTEQTQLGFLSQNICISNHFWW